MKTGIEYAGQDNRVVWLGVETIWGYVDYATQVADGIVFVATASHGGYIISLERHGEMPLYLRGVSFTGDRHFEEDCSWAAVVCAWPDLFETGLLNAAVQTLKSMYPYAYKRYREEVLGIGGAS